MYSLFSILLCQSFKREMWTKFGGNDEIVCNYCVTWPLTMWSHGKLRTLYHKFHEDTITKLGCNTYLNKMIPYDASFIITRLLYSYMPFLYVMWSRNSLKTLSATFQKTITTKLGGNTYKNERVAYLHITWVNHGKVIKGAAAKVALMKGTNLSRSRDFWLYDILTNEKRICNFYRSC